MSKSSWVQRIATSLADRTANVKLKNGDIYSYSDVSRKAILNLRLNPNQSLGKWVNNNCKKNAHLEIDACFTAAQLPNFI